MFHHFLYSHFFFFYDVCFYFYLCFFFFQAEDGIRDGRVTGVQTCALPIFVDRSMLVEREIPDVDRLQAPQAFAKRLTGEAESERPGKHLRKKREDGRLPHGSQPSGPILTFAPCSAGSSANVKIERPLAKLSLLVELGI